MSGIPHWLPLLDKQDEGHGVDEVRLVAQVGVGLYDLDTQVAEYQACKVVLTTHRILLYTAAAVSTTLDLFLPLQHVLSVVVKGGFGSWSHPKLVLPVSGSRSHHYKLSFRMGGERAFADALETALTQRHWTKVLRPSVVTRREPLSALPPPQHINAPLQAPAPESHHADPAVEAYSVTHTDNVGISRILAAQQRRTEDAQQRLRLEPSHSSTPSSSSTVGSSSTRGKLDAVLDDTKRLVQAIADARQLYEKEGGSKENEQRLISVEAALGLGTTAATSTVGSSDRAAKFHYICELSLELLRWVTHRDNTVLKRRPVLPVLELYAAYSSARRGRPVTVSDFWDALCVCTGESVPERLKRGARGAMQTPVDVVQAQIQREHRSSLESRGESQPMPISTRSELAASQTDFIPPCDKGLSIRRYPSVGVAVVCLEPMLSSLAPLLHRQLGECDPSRPSQTTPALFGAALGMDSSTAFAVLGGLESVGLLCRSVVGADGAAGWVAQTPSYFYDDRSGALDTGAGDDVIGGPLNTAFHWNLFGYSPG